MAANLAQHLAGRLREQGVNGVSHQLFCSLQKVPAAKIGEALKAYR